MAEYRTETCRSCPAQVIWAATTAGKVMPVDAEPHPAGTVALVDRPGRNPLAQVIPAADRAGRQDLRRSHFATCPAAGRWRRR